MISNFEEIPDAHGVLYVIVGEDNNPAAFTNPRYIVKSKQDAELGFTVDGLPSQRYIVLTYATEKNGQVFECPADLRNFQINESQLG